MVRIGVAFLLTAALSGAQSLEIRGTVTEPNTNHLLADVDVTILPGNGILAPGVEATKLTTDSQGAFRFVPPKVGQYVVRVNKAGYTRTAVTGRGFPSDQASVMITAEKPTAELHLALEHTGELTGRVIDDETEAPLANFKVGINTYSSTNGHPSARGGTITTDADGRFRAERPAGDYLVEIRPQVTGKDHLLNKFSAEDTKATDLDYRAAFFPGGPEVEVALPVPLSSGGIADVGTVRVRKQPLYRVYVKLDPASCPPGGEPIDGTEAIVRFQSSETSLLGTFPCGPLLLTHMTLGTYELQLRAGKTPEENVAAVVRYTVTGQNLELPVTLSRGFPLAGRIIAAEGAGDLPFASFNVSFGPVSSGIAASEVQPHSVDVEGRFAYSNIQFGRKKVQVAGLGSQYYIKELRYNDVAAPGNIFDFTGNGDLQIEIDRSPAALSGSVTKGDKAVPGADVVFLRWPPLPEDDREAIRHIAADSDGKFHISGIVPGEYRIFAVPGEGRAQAGQPLAWQRLLGRAEKVTLARGDSQNLVLEVGDPSR